METRSKRARSVAAALPTDTILKKSRTHQDVQEKDIEVTLPPVQSALKLHTIRQPYDVTTNHPLPTIQHDSELLVKVQAVGLNPIDWKAP
jgi:hypothetical protein